ncbi:MAG: peptidylprolyl isomerase [Gemmataceae bacterium]
MVVRVSRFRSLALSTFGVCAISSNGAMAQQAQKSSPTQAPASNVVPASGTSIAANSAEVPPVRVVAYIYGNVPITREELGDFLIARGGYDKIDLLINRKIIETECAKRKITVTPQEMEAVLNEDMKGLSLEKDQFLSQLLPRYNKTYYELMEDVIKPRLQLKKLCQDQVKVSDEDLRKQYESIYGEKRRIQIVMWPKDQLKVAQEQFAKARISQEEFDRVARNQAQPSLASSAGHVLPITKYQTGKDEVIERSAFKLKPGEISEILEIKGQPAFAIIKLHEIIAPDPKITFESKKEELYKAAFDKKVEEYIPEYFSELKKQANPTMPLIGPPKDWQLDIKTQRPKTGSAGTK